MKKSAILAAAVASLMVVGVAQADTKMYGKARMFIELATESLAGAKDKGVSSYSSRIGWKGSEDLGNGMSAVYQFEVAYSAGNAATPFSTRVGYAGIKGDFGQVAIGQQWTPSYVLVRGKHDPMNTTAGGNVYGGGFPVATRINDAISYINTFGGIKFAAATIASNNGATDVDADSLNDHTDLAVSIPAGPVTIGVALANSNPTAGSGASPTAINVGWASGAISLDVGLFMTDRDDVVATTTVDEGSDWFSVVGKFKTDSGTIVAQIEDDGNETQTNFAYIHKLSKKTSLMAELTSGDLAADETNIGIHINF